MNTIVLRTKLYPPPNRPQTISRRHLLVRLDQLLPRKLTIISAPAGYGKTTLAVAWLQDKPFVWLSLDDADNDPLRFLTYLCVTLQEQDPALAQTAVSLLQSAAETAPRDIAGILLNEIALRPAPLFLALDDYHLIENAEIHDLLAFLLKQAPPNLHIVITSRMELPFSISRYHVRRQVVELRAADLRFTAAETGVFLNDLMGLALTAESVAALDQRTEGWVAGLQLAALSLSRQEAAKRTAFIEKFAGSNRYLMDYLVDEILHLHSEEEQRFLTRTAVLSRFNAGLCTTVAGDDGRVNLYDLEQTNLFLIALDEQREWFRYHHLFADLLRHQLTQREPELLPELHRRAADWFAAAGYLDDAIHHALQASDYARAADLLSTHIEQMVVRGQIREAMRSISRLPAAHRARDLRLRFYYAWVLMFVGRLAEAETELAALDGLPNPDGWPMPAFGDVLRGYIATRSGDFSAGIAFSKNAHEQLDQVTAPDQTMRVMHGAAAINLAHSYLFVNEIARALPLARQAADLNIRAGNGLAGMAAVAIEAQLLVAHGRLRAAARTIQQGLAAAAAWAEQLPGQSRHSLATAPLLLELGKLHLQWNEIDQAAPILEEAAELYRLTGATNEPDGLAGLLHLHWAREDPTAVTAVLDSLHALVARQPPDFTLRRLRAGIVEWQSRLLLLGHGWSHWRQEAADFARDHQEVSAAPLAYMFEFEYIALVRAWLCLGEAQKALALLARLSDFALATGREGDDWRFTLLTILALAQSGVKADAVAQLQGLLLRTEPEGIIGLYTAEGAPLAELLKKCDASAYRDQLLTAFTTEKASGGEETAVPQTLIEPLSPRELEVLALLATGATNQVVADTLVVSYATAKKHVSNILGKLGVGNRTEAVARARALNLLS